jgi:hypothetical protein
MILFKVLLCLFAGSKYNEIVCNGNPKMYNSGFAYKTLE